MSANSTPKLLLEQACSPSSRVSPTIEGDCATRPVQEGQVNLSFSADHRQAGPYSRAQHQRGLDRPWVECRRCRQGNYRRSVSPFPACIPLLGEGSAGIVSEEAVPAHRNSGFDLKLYRSRRTKLTRRTIRI